MELSSTMREGSGGGILSSQITMTYGQTLRKLGPSTQRRMNLETFTVERRQD